MAIFDYNPFLNFSFCDLGSCWFSFFLDVFVFDLWTSDRLQMGEVVSTIPSWYSVPKLSWFYALSRIFFFVMRCDFVVLVLSAIGFNVETVQYKNIKFQVWDLGMWLALSFLMLLCLFWIVELRIWCSPTLVLDWFSLMCKRKWCFGNVLESSCESMVLWLHSYDRDTQRLLKCRS